MDPGAFDQVGSRIETAPIVGGLLRRKETGRHAHRHEGGLVVEVRDGTLVLAYATAQVFALESAEPAGDDPLKGRAEWRFEPRGGGWATGSIERASPLAALCRGAVRASTQVRLAIVRERLAGGDTVDFGAGAATVHEVWVHGHRPMPWAEATGIEDRGIEGVLLHTATRGDFTLASTALQVADLAVLVALIEDGR
ncbi:MAG TPA: hypothetical protein VGO60_18235 [Iamia sp.]|nr:hypothetical protein [Iamia sp.]